MALHTWKTDSDKERLALYRENRFLYKGEFLKVWKRLAPPDREFKVIVMNDARNITDALANLLFREAPDYTAESVPAAQPEIERIIRDTAFNALLKKQATWGSVYGDMLFLVRLEDSKVMIDFVDPTLFFGEFAPFNTNKLIRANLIHPLKDAEDKDITHAYKQIHEPGVIIHQLWLADNDGLLQQVPLDGRRETIGLLEQIDGLMGLDGIQATGVDRLLLIHAKNAECPGEPYGESDYTKSLKSKFRARTALMTQFDMVRAKHSNPKLALPQSVIDSLRDEHSGRVVVNRDDFNLVGLNPGEDAKMITWDGELKVSLSEDEKLQEQTFEEAKVAPALLGKSFGSTLEGGETGRANIMKFQASLGLAHTKQQLMLPALREVLFVAQLLENTLPDVSYEPSEVRINFKDGLPGDFLTQIQGIDIRLNQGTISRKKAIMDMDGTTEADAEKSIGEIDEEKPESVVPSENTGHEDEEE